MASVAAFTALAKAEFFSFLNALSQGYGYWQIDKLFAASVVATFSLAVLLILQERRLRTQVARRRRAQKLAGEAALFDSLTGIANRIGFHIEFTRELSEAKENGTRLALLVIDVDQMRAVNETNGHAAGDEVLRQLAARLRGVLRRDGSVARLGSGEFAILFPMGTDETDELFRLASRILVRLREPFETLGNKIAVTASIGISKYPRDGNLETVLLQSAEMALQQAKVAGKDRYVLYDSDLDARRRERLSLENDFKRGLERGEIIAVYQPLVDLATLRTVGFEALARWQHPERGLLPPAEFIPIAEDGGLVDPLFTAMLQKVSEDISTWGTPLTVALNLSPVQLLDVRLPARVLDNLMEMGISAEQIELEITETGLLLDFETARRTLTALKKAGTRISLDDFGTGFSSLRHLNELPIDKIKIDRSFTRRIATDAQSCKIISSMLGLGLTLGLTTVAEGVETNEEADFLRRHGCQLGQGYLFARPLPPQEAFGPPAGRIN